MSSLMKIGQAPFSSGDDPVVGLVGMVFKSDYKQMKRAAEADASGDEYSRRDKKRRTT